jgi:hypothetical protein
VRVFIPAPGQFYDGFNSKLRGEGRWLVNIAGALADAGHDVTIFSNDMLRPYTDRGVDFESILNVHSNIECDIVVSMEPFPDVPHLGKSDLSPRIAFLKSEKRVQALFFPTDDSVYDYIPVIHPWNWDNKGYFVPIITHSEVSPPGFDRSRFHWYSKTPHETPEYLVGVLKGLRELITEHGCSGGLFIDGAWFMSDEYRNITTEKEEAAKILFTQIMQTEGSESLVGWAPFDYIQESIITSKLLVGLHHPVAAPSMAEALAAGSLPIIFENQKGYPPFDKCDFPFIPLGTSESEIVEFITKAWTDKDFFEKSVLSGQEAIADHAQDRASRLIVNFFEEL